jgi:hypothetical protein
MIAMPSKRVTKPARPSTRPKRKFRPKPPTPKFWNDERAAWGKRDRDPAMLEPNHAVREFRLTLGPMGESDPTSWTVRLSRRQQVLEDAETFALSLSLRLKYHPNSVYIFSLADQPQPTREAVLRALARSRQLVIRNDRASWEFHISQAPGWREGVPAPEATTVEQLDQDLGIHSSGTDVAVEELDDLTLHLRRAVDNLMQELRPKRGPNTDQLELFQ